MGIRFYTDRKGVMVFRNEKDGKTWYNVSLGRKEGDTWINLNKVIRFKDSPDIPNKTIVHIKDGFVDVDSWVKDGREYVRDRLIALDYTYDGQKEKPRQTFVEMPDFDLPNSFSAAEEELPF